MKAFKHTQILREGEPEACAALGLTLSVSFLCANPHAAAVSFLCVNPHTAGFRTHRAVADQAEAAHNPKLHQIPGQRGTSQAGHLPGSAGICRAGRGAGQSTETMSVTENACFFNFPYSELRGGRILNSAWLRPCWVLGHSFHRCVLNSTVCRTWLTELLPCPARFLCPTSSHCSQLRDNEHEDVSTPKLS